MNNLINTIMAVRLVLTLMHSLWEGAAIALLAGMGAFTFRRWSAALRYQIFFAAMVLTAFAAAFTFTHLSSGSNASPKPDTSPGLAPAVEIHPPISPSPSGGGSPIHFGAAPRTANPTPPSTAPQVVNNLPVKSRFDWKRYAPWLAQIYAAGVVLMLLRLSIAIRGGRRLRVSAQPLTDPGILAALQRQAVRLGLRLAPAAGYSSRVLVPTVVGILSPAILLPVSISTGLSLQTVEAILAHELAHIRRYDHLLQFVQRLIEAAFFFNPAIWYLSRHIRLERENACDDLAARTSLERRDYANALLQAAELCVLARQRASEGMNLAMANRSDGLRQRIARLLEPAADSRFRLPGVCTASVLLILAVTLSLGLHQHAKAAGSSAATTQPGYDLSGIITDEQGRPISNAMIAPVGDNLWLGAKTDFQGKFLLKNIRSDQVQFFALSQRRVLMTAFTADHTTRDLGAIVLDCAVAEVKGRIVNTAGLPIAGAKIDLHLTGPNQTVYTLKEGQTDNSGEYVVGMIPARKGFSITVSLHDKSGKNFQTPAVAIRRQFLIEMPDVVTDALPPAAQPGPAPVRYSGHVLDQQTHQPIEGVKLNLSHPISNGTFWDMGAVLTDADGKWSCLGPPGLSRINTNLDHPDYIGKTFDHSQSEVPIQAMLDGSAVQYMKRGQRISGHVVGPDGKPVWNALVLGGPPYSTTGGDDEAIEDSADAHTDRDGSFSIGGMPTGQQQLVVSADGMAPTFFPLLVSAQTPPAVVKMQAGHDMSGRVIDENGHPIADAHVNIGGWTMPDAYSRPLPQKAMTDGNGRFQFSGLPSQGEFRLYAGKKGRLTDGFDVIAAAADIGNVMLCTNPQFTGRVVDDVTGKPVNDFNIKLGCVMDNGEVEYSGLDDSADRTDGKFDMCECSWIIDRDGRTQFCAEIIARGYAPQVTPYVMACHPSPAMTIRLKRAAAITGTVVDAQNTPVANAQVFWVPPTRDVGIIGGKIDGNYGYKLDLSATTDSTGKFYLPASSQPGRILVLHEKGYALLASGDYHSDAPLKLNAWARIEGNYLPDGKPAEGVRITAITPPVSSDPAKYDRLNFELNTTTNADGHFVIDHVPSLQLLRLTAEAAYGPAAFADIFPQPGQALHVDLGREGSPMNGRIDLSRVIAVNPPPQGMNFDTSTSWIRAVRIDPPPQPPAGADPAGWNAQLASVLNGTATENLLIPAYFADLQTDGSFSFVGLPVGKYELLAVIHGERPPGTCGWGLVLARGHTLFTVAGAPLQLPPLTLDAIPHPAIGSMAPEITGKDSTGKDFAISSLRGKYVVLDFWAGWCEPCRAALPLLRDVCKKHTSANVAFVGLNYDYTPAAAARAITAAAVPWRNILLGPWDGNSPTLQAYDVSLLPSLWVIDPQGRIAARDPTPDQLDALLSKKP